MEKRVDSKTFGLPEKTIVDQIGKNHYAIVIYRKSRIIMSDGKRILEKADKIKKIQPKARISLNISGPICSKTKTYLQEHNIDLIQE